MQVLGDATIKRFADTDSGELVAFGTRTRNLGIVLAPQDGDGRLIGMVTVGEEPHPRMIFGSPKSECLSFGTNWAIEPLSGDQSFPSLHERTNLAGLLAQTAEGWLMSFATSGVDSVGRFTTQWWNISSNKQENLGDRAALFASWRIWQSSDEWRNNARATPVHEYTATAPQRR